MPPTPDELSTVLSALTAEPRTQLVIARELHWLPAKDVDAALLDLQRRGEEPCADHIELILDRELP